jgi:hypothetical protein
VLIGTVLAGCSDEPPASRGPYFDDIVAASKDAKSDFERKVLSDGSITRAEYEESVQKLVACGDARGVSISPVSQGVTYSYEVKTSETSDAVMAECSVGTTQVIENLYGEMTKNPTKADYEALVAACLARSGLAPAGYTKTQYLRDRSAAKEGEVVKPDFPFDQADQRLADCESNPSSH